MPIERPRALARVKAALAAFPVVALCGPRQCGKTALARSFAESEPVCAWFDLENAADCRQLESPEQALGGLRGLVVIDEIQRQPQLLAAVRRLLDRPESSVRFLLLGNASPVLIKGAAAALSGRMAMVVLAGLDLQEVPAAQWQTLWQRGGFPRCYLAADEAAAAVWCEDYVDTFLERDVPSIGITIPAATLRRFWSMLAHYHGQVWNAAEFARALGTSEGTARNYLDIFERTYMIRVLTSWHEDLKKRQVKSPKIYIRDTGLLHALLELKTFAALSGHPKIGASFEGFVVEQILAAIGTRRAHFWATHGGAELDVLVSVGEERYGFACQYSDEPRTTRSMRVAMTDLRLSHLWVVHPGREVRELDVDISAVPVGELASEGFFARVRAPADC